MSEVDKESKTEEASEKKIQDAFDEGNIPVAKEAATFATFLAILTLVSFVIGPGAKDLAGTLFRLLDDPDGIRLHHAADARKLLQAVGLSMGAFMLPVVGVLALFGVGASVAQNAPRLVVKRIAPKLSRISPKQGWNRIFGFQGWVEFAKAIFKFALVGAVVALLLRAEHRTVVNAMFSDPTQVPELILTLTVRLLSAVCIVTVLLVLADLALSRFHWRKELRMTKQEVKDEHKQAEGDPLVKSRLRSLARDRSRRRMLADVPRATVVLANPTHYAIALRYVREEGGAPLVIAKGQNLIALKIREIAEQHGIPVVEDKALVRSMYGTVELDRTIPPEFYRVVAEILCLFYNKLDEAR